METFNYNDIINILFKNWDKIVLLVSILGFFIREIFVSNLKKEEHKFSVTYNEMVKSINNYIEAFDSYRTSMIDLPLEFINHNFPSKELDKYVVSPINKLKHCDLVLSLYIDKNSYKTYRKITDSSINLSDRLHIIIMAVLNNETEYWKIYDKELTIFKETTNKLLKQIHTDNQSKISNTQNGYFTRLFRRKEQIYNNVTLSKQDIANISYVPRLMTLIETNQNTLKEYMEINHLLTEELKKVKGELAMLKNERNIG